MMYTLIRSFNTFEKQINDKLGYAVTVDMQFPLTEVKVSKQTPEGTRNIYLEINTIVPRNVKGKGIHQEDEETLLEQLADNNILVRNE